MIHRFFVENFLSIRDSVELNFKIPGTTPNLPRFRVSPSTPNTRLPTAVVFFGPNSSGKTTILKAMQSTLEFMSDSVAYESDRGVLHFPEFDFNCNPTYIEIEFDGNLLQTDSRKDNRFRYVLEIHRKNDLRKHSWVEYEVLHYFPEGRAHRVFERIRDRIAYVSNDIKSQLGGLSSVLIADNVSVISILAKLKIEPFALLVKNFSSNQSNLANSSQLEENRIVRKYINSQGLVEKASEILPKFDFGIEKFKIAQSSSNEMQLEHLGLKSPLGLRQESSGTRGLIKLLPLIHDCIEAGGFAILDDFDIKFHSDLTAELIRWFHSEEQNPHGAQLLCSSHDFTLLDKLEKEEVYIAEKDHRNGNTAIYSIKDFSNIRRTENLQKLYRSGAFGGVPHFG